jgi:hypothetical protein
MLFGDIFYQRAEKNHDDRYQFAVPTALFGVREEA